MKMKKYYSLQVVEEHLNAEQTVITHTQCDVSDCIFDSENKSEFDTIEEAETEIERRLIEGWRLSLKVTRKIFLSNVYRIDVRYKAVEG